MTPDESNEMAKQRLLVAAADREVQRVAGELIESRNLVGDMRYQGNDGVAALNASQQRVALVLQALDFIKRAGLVRP